MKLEIIILLSVTRTFIVLLQNVHTFPHALML